MATSEFGKAFAAARKAGDRTFTWNGKSYTTELKEEVNGSERKRVTKDVVQQAQASDDPIGVIARAATGSLNDRDAESTQTRGRKVKAYPKPDLHYGGAGRGKKGGPGIDDLVNSDSAKYDAGAGRGTQGMESFKKGGSVRGWGKAKGARAAKVY